MGGGPPPAFDLDARGGGYTTRPGRDDRGLLDEIEKREGPSAAFKAYVSLIEYAVPKMARNELAGEDGKTEIIVRWQGEQ